MTIHHQRLFPLSAEIEQAIATLKPQELAWLSGYCWAFAQKEGSLIPGGFTQANAQPVAPLRITVLSGSQTGNAKSVALALTERLNALGVEVSYSSLADYKAKQIAQESVLFLVTSTQGEGEPPEEAVLLYKLLHGKKAPDLSQLAFAVLGLGDSSYPKFCQAGKDFDQRFAALGGKRIFDLTEADLAFQETAQQWVNRVEEWVSSQQAQPTAAPSSQTAPVTAPVISAFGKNNPFPARLLTNQKITGKHSQKDVRHIELDLSDSGLTYQAGDALGVWFENDPALVAEILSVLSLSGEEIIELNGQSISLAEALGKKVEITQVPHSFVQKYAEYSDSPLLHALINDNEQLNRYVQTTQLVDILREYPATLTALQFIGLLRPLAPRLYSIASASAEVGEEVHLTVGVVQFEHEGHRRTGAASGFLAERVGEDGPVNVFIEPNAHFRLPSDNDKAIIMIGAGTGIAPFRAFMQQRVAEGAQGKHWLIFGNPQFSQDFLYQTEWQQWAKEKYLTAYDFAWSRDQAEKIYVQHKLLEKGAQLWQWLQDGAYLYVCGDAKKMAKDVEQALLSIFREQGKLSEEDAEAYLDTLREEKRYQRDVY